MYIISATIFFLSRYSRDAVDRERGHSTESYSHEVHTFTNTAVLRHAPGGNLGLPAAPTAAPRPHSADFLEFERNHPLQGGGAGRGAAVPFADQTNRPGGGHHTGGRPKSQPPRPKSSIGELRRPADDFWSEQGYAQKMRESAYAYDPATASRSQSRAGRGASIGRSATTQEFGEATNVIGGGMNLNMSQMSHQSSGGGGGGGEDDGGFHPLQLSPARQGPDDAAGSQLPGGQLPPPVGCIGWLGQLIPGCSQVRPKCYKIK